jgi:hypothetical protein
MRFSASAASLALAIAATVPLAPAAAAGPNITVQNVQSRSSVNGCSDFRFDADIVAKDWPAGMPHVITYHWETSANAPFPIRKITIPATGKEHTHASHTPKKGKVGFAWVHILTPVNFRSARVGFSNPEC